MSFIKRSIVAGAVLSLAGAGSVAGFTATASAATAASASTTSAATTTVDAASTAKAASMSSAADAKPAPKTKIVKIAPFKPSGQLKKGWRTHLVKSADPIDCSTDTGSESAVNGGTHACGATADAANACWTTPKFTNSILCLNNPWSKTLNRRTAANVPSKTKAPKHPMPLALQLSDNSKWTLRIGGAWGGRADGLVGVYGCASGCKGYKNQAILAKPNTQGINRSKALWTVQVGELGDPDQAYPAPKRHAVKQAWYIKNTVKSSGK